MTKKILSMALAIAMVMALSVTAFAAEGDGSITINDAVSGETYTAYRIFDLISYSGTNFAYQVNEDWTGFINQATIKGVYVNVDENGTVTWIDGADAQAFAKAALVYAEANQIDAVDSVKATSATVAFTGLELGYYLVDTSLGALCSLDTNVQNAVVYEKNMKPTMTKEVKEDSTGNWGSEATADITDVVEFRLTVNTGSDTDYAANDNGINQDYVITDTLPAGMTYKAITMPTGWTLNEHYTVNYEKDVLTITLKAAKLATLGEDVDIVINYTASVDADAVIAGNGNINKATLKYSEQTTTEVTATVYTYQLDVLKYTGTESNPLAGAQFVLKKGAEYAVVDANGVLTGWTSYLTLPEEGAPEGAVAATVFTTPADGKFVVKGLDADKYALEETVAPDGYNLLVEDVEFEIKTANVEQKIENKTGTELPSTGGIGTTIFYALGAVMVIGAGVLLVAKKRMSIEG